MLFDTIKGKYQYAPLCSQYLSFDSTITKHNVDLPFDKTYNKRFGSREGVRELIQNCYDGAKSSALHFKHDTIKVEKQIVTENELVYRFVGQELLLGAIVMKKSSEAATKCDLYLYNFGVRLKTSMIMIMGRTSKPTTNDAEFQGKQIEPWIGMHGEGSLCGIIGLLREQVSVQYYTNSQMWKFSFIPDSTDAKKEILHAEILANETNDFDCRHTTVVVLKNLNCYAFDPSQFLFLSRIDFQPNSGWRFLSKNAESTKSLNSGIEIFPLNSSEQASIFNRSIEIQPCRFPFHLNILDNIAGVCRDRNSIGTDAEGIFLDYILPNIILKPAKTNQNVELNVDAYALMEFFYHQFQNSQFDKFSKTVRYVYETLKTSSSSEERKKQTRLFAKILFEVCIKIHKKQEIIPYDENDGADSHKACKDAGLDVRALVPVSTCLYTIFDNSGLVEDIKKAGRLLQTKLFQSPLLNVQTLESESKRIFNDIREHVAGFTKHSNIIFNVRDIRKSQVPSQVLKKLSSSALVQVRYSKDDRTLDILSSCFLLNRVHAVNRKAFRLDRDNGTKSTVRNLQCENSDKLCRCLLNMILKEIAAKHNWSDTDVSRYWSNCYAPPKKVDEDLDEEVETEAEELIKKAEQEIKEMKQKAEELKKKAEQEIKEMKQKVEQEAKEIKKKAEQEVKEMKEVATEMQIIKEEPGTNLNNGERSWKVPKLDSQEEQKVVRQQPQQLGDSSSSIELKHKPQSPSLGSNTNNILIDKALTEIMKKSSELKQIENESTLRHSISNNDFPIEQNNCCNFTTEQCNLVPNSWFDVECLPFYLYSDLNLSEIKSLESPVLEFSKLLKKLFIHVYPEVNVQNVCVFYTLPQTSNSSTVAYNAGKLYFSLRHFITNRNLNWTVLTQAFYWFSTIAHELVHYECKLHDQNFQVLKDCLVTNRAESFSN